MLWFGQGNFVYKYTNQSLKYTNGTFRRKSLNVPDEYLYLSITVERFTMYNPVASMGSQYCLHSSLVNSP